MLVNYVLNVRFFQKVSLGAAPTDPCPPRWRGDEAYACPGEDGVPGSVGDDFIEAKDDEPDREVLLEGPGR
jgi:hypothetical protein